MDPFKMQLSNSKNIALKVSSSIHHWHTIITYHWLALSTHMNNCTTEPVKHTHTRLTINIIQHAYVTHAFYFSKCRVVKWSCNV